MLHHGGIRLGCSTKKETAPADILGDRYASSESPKILVDNFERLLWPISCNPPGGFARKTGGGIRKNAN